MKIYFWGSKFFYRKNTRSWRWELVLLLYFGTLFCGAQGCIGGCTIEDNKSVECSSKSVEKFCAGELKEESKELEKQNKQDVWLTVFIHGTFGSHLSVFDIYAVLNDECDGSLYEKIQRWRRKSNFSYSVRFLSAVGLHEIVTCTDNPTWRAIQVVWTYKKIQEYINTQAGLNEHLYTFGWNGLLSQKARVFEAINLYCALSKEICRYKALGYNPKVRLIAHSHGGNVCLLLGAIWSVLNKVILNDKYACKTLIQILRQLKRLPEYDKVTDKNVLIDELFLLATPIQQETEALVQCGCFKKIFNFYSETDLIQLMDFFSTKGRYNKRIVPEFNLKNIYQARILVEHRLQKTSVKELFLDVDNCLDFMQWLRYNDRRYPYDPGHIDFFDIFPKNIKSFYYPIPIAAFIPLILQAYNNCSHDLAHKDINIVLDRTVTAMNCSLIDNKSCENYATGMLPFSLVDRVKGELLSWLKTI